MELKPMIARAARMLILPPAAPLDPTRLLSALAQVESDGGRRGEAGRVEVHFINRIRRRHPALYTIWGDRLALSYGPFQVLAITAYELGYDGPPERLAIPEVSLFWACEYLNHKLFLDCHRGLFNADTETVVRRIGDLYNSGRAGDAVVPREYMDRLWAAYEAEGVQ